MYFIERKIFSKGISEDKHILPYGPRLKYAMLKFTFT